MSWEHCGNSVADTEGCPACGISKAAWTVEFNVTRQLKVRRSHALRVEVVDASGAPLAGEPFEVTRADGTTSQGTLDDLGCARVPTPEAEEASIAFPGRGPGALVDAEPEAEGGVAGGDRATFRWRTTRRLRLCVGRFLRVLVKDGRGRAVADVGYVVLTPGGERRGRTDAQGILHEAGLPAGDLKLRLEDGRVLLFQPPPGEDAPEEPEPRDLVHDEEDFSRIVHHGDREVPDGSDS